MRVRTRVLLLAVFGSCWLSACGSATGEAAGAPQAAPVPAAPVHHPEAPAHPVPAPAAVALPEVPAGAKVFFVSPADGATLTGPLENGKVSVSVEMGATGIAIKPAGAVEAGSGHHHILIDTDPVPLGTPVPMDEQHLHFGKGQTQAKIGLTLGTHSLMLQLADGIHRSYGPALAANIKVNVVALGSVGDQPTQAAP